MSHSVRDPPRFPYRYGSTSSHFVIPLLARGTIPFPPSHWLGCQLFPREAFDKAERDIRARDRGGTAQSCQSAFPPSFTPELHILLTALRSSNLETSPTPKLPILQLKCLPVRESRMRNRKRSFRHFLPKGQTKKRSEFLPLTSFFQPRVCCYDELADVRLSLRLSPTSGAQLYYGPKYPLDQAHLLFLSPPLETSFSDCQRSALTAFF